MPISLVYLSNQIIAASGFPRPDDLHHNSDTIYILSNISEANRLQKLHTLSIKRRQALDLPDLMGT